MTDPLVMMLVDLQGQAIRLFTEQMIDAAATLKDAKDTIERQTMLIERQGVTVERLREHLEEFCTAAADIHPTAPSSTSIDRLHAAIGKAGDLLPKKKPS